MTMRRWIAIAGALLIFAVSGGEIHDLQNAYAQVAQKAFPAVVVINVYRHNGYRLVQIGTGSGFFVSPDGVIVTNHHVIERADAVTIRLENRRTYEAQLLGSIPDADLAVLKIAGIPSVPFLEFGNSSMVKAGHYAIAIGAPFNLSYTMTTGVISHVGRRFNAKYPHAFIQTDAAINPGNSGGPLLNIDGEVIGVNDAYFTPLDDQRQGGNVGIGFAIDGNLAKNKVQQVLSKVRHRPSLGIYIRDHKPQGVLVTKVFAFSAAEKAGLKEGDILLKINERSVASATSFIASLFHNHRVGDEIVLLIQRNGKNKTIKAKLERRIQ